jgi:hypothetical protein
MALINALLGCVLIWARHRYFGIETLGNYALAGAMALQFVGYQQMLAGEARRLGRGLEWSQWGWFAFALCLPGEGPALGSAGFLALQLMAKAPLQGLLKRNAPAAHPWLLLLAFLAMVGCLPFASFSAYFQAFIPLMAVGDSVSSMQQKLFSGAGLWAAIVLLSVVYQSCALGYFYWSQVMQAPPEEAPAGGREARILGACLLLSAALGLSGGFYGAGLRWFLTSIRGFPSW